MKKFNSPIISGLCSDACILRKNDPDMDKLDNNYLVYTNYDKKADFKTFETYYLPDSILVIGDRKTPNTGKMRMPRKFSALMLLT